MTGGLTLRGLLVSQKNLFYSERRKREVHNMPGYKALTYALLNPNTGELITHVDSMNDWREGYNRVATYSKMLDNGWRLTIIAYTRRIAGDFIIIYVVRHYEISFILPAIFFAKV